MNFPEFFVGESGEFVVEVDGFEWFDEERVAAGTGAVDDAIHPTPLAGDNGNHEAIIADGDDFFLKKTFVAMSAEEPLE